MSAVKHSLVCIFLILLVCATLRVDGRYLPTRSDSSRYERIKEVLRALLELNDAEFQNSRQNFAYDDVMRSKRDASNQHPSSPVHV
ncbi:hypothetical protein X975_05262, partial [Stegodyphus mimosarum]